MENWDIRILQSKAKELPVSPDMLPMKPAMVADAAAVEVATTYRDDAKSAYIGKTMMIP